MGENVTSEIFYAGVPVFDDFRRLMDAAIYAPLPDDWSVGIADVVQSTKAIAERRYKAVNMAGAAVIAAVTNALAMRPFPFVFGGDGASFAVAPSDRDAAAEALAATAAWAAGELGLTLRVALVPVAAIRAAGRDVRVARYAPSPNVSYAMFSGGGLGWADAEIKRGRFALAPAAPGTWPDLAGLSCRFAEFRAARGVILAVLILPSAGSDPAAFRALIEDVVAMVEESPEACRPVPEGGPALHWPTAGTELEVRAAPGDRRRWRRVAVRARTLLVFLIMRLGIRVGRFEPKTYMRQLVANTDFRKYDDGLRMILDCSPALAGALERRLAAAAGIAAYGLHRQQSAMMTCFTPSPTRSDHVHFVDGAEGGYAAAASALKSGISNR